MIMAVTKTRSLFSVLCSPLSVLNLDLDLKLFLRH
jgi:hypothetical protein